MTTISPTVSRRKARLALDPKLSKARTAASALPTPRRGWIREIRTSLGMSAADLAKRMELNTSTVLRMERGESQGTIQLMTLKKAAEALNCDLVYALIPRESLVKSVQNQALKKAIRMMAPIEHTMGLENQSVPKHLAEEIRKDLITIWQNKPGLWNDAE